MGGMWISERELRITDNSVPLLLNGINLRCETFRLKYQWQIQQIFGVVVIFPVLPILFPRIISLFKFHRF